MGRRRHEIDIDQRKPIECPTFDEISKRSTIGSGVARADAQDEPVRHCCAHHVVMNHP
jgi:hypothetical protein